MERELANGPPVQRLLYRRLPAGPYHPVGVRHEWEDQRDPHCCEATPYLIFNEMRLQELPRSSLLEQLYPNAVRPPGWAGNWFGVRRFDLTTGDDRLVLDEGSLNPPPPFTRGWVSQILSVSPDGSAAVCAVGLEAGSEMKYFVYDVSLREGLRQRIADLPNVFL